MAQSGTLLLCQNLPVQIPPIPNSPPPPPPPVCFVLEEISDQRVFARHTTSLGAGCFVFSFFFDVVDHHFM